MLKNKITVFLFLLLTLLVVGFSASLSASQTVNPIIGEWQRSVCRCGFNNCGVFAGDCRGLDQGTWRACTTAPFCINAQTPRPWTSQSLMEARMLAHTGLSFIAWRYPGTNITPVCPGRCWGGDPQFTLGVLSAVNGNFSGLWTATKSRSVECPNGYTPSGQQCVPNGVTLLKTNNWCPSGANDSDPIHSYTGINIQEKTDFRDDGVFPLEFTRYYAC